MPAILIEGGYMTHPVESKKIYDAAYRRQMAQAIVIGILTYQRLVSPPPLDAANRSTNRPVAKNSTATGTGMNKISTKNHMQLIPRTIKNRMSIATKTGDDGTTALMYGRRVAKTHPRIEACGAVDELNAALGLARASAKHDFVRGELLVMQKDLMVLMGEMGVATEDLPRYVRDGHPVVTPGMTAKLDALVREIEAQKIHFKGWATPGETMDAATLDLARTVCRRAERRVCALKESGELQNVEIVIYLNRLGDLLWLVARWVETKVHSAQK